MNLEFLLAFLVLFHLVPRFSTEEFKPTSRATCPKDFQCGNLGIMSFPFYNSSDSYCGLCLVDCFTHPTPKIKLNLMSDQWFSCNSWTQRNFKLHDPVLHGLLIDRSCDVFHYNISLPRSASISYAILSNITLFKCEKNPEPSKEVVDHFRGYSKNESCPDFNIYYRNPKSESSSEEPPPPGCTTVLLPVHPWDNVSDNTELFPFLTAHFDLEWHLSDECHDCYLKGGFCWPYDESKFHCSNDDTGNKKRKIILSTAVPACGVVFFVILVFCVRRNLPFCNSLDFWKIKTEDHNVEAFLKNYGSLAPKRYHYSDVKKMTNSFSIKLGRGGYGSVYKGKLKDGSLVAVKVLKESKGNGEEFINEVASISRTSHVNIVTLFGFCFQGGKKALIYEFMPNGSLEKFIYVERSLMNSQLEWKTLYKIAVGIARGLEYLHRGCNTRILHFDIKPHNILLDEDFCPKISDFGLAKLCPGKESIISTLTARGTIGYIAPEVVCKSVGEVSHKSDVYSYGMMVLEMVGGRKNVDVGVDRSSEIYFPNWIYTRLDRGEELGLSGILDEEENEKARKMLIVSLWCIQVHPSYRPTITNVLEMLEGPLEALQMPPKPLFCSPSRASSEGSTTVVT